MVMEHVGGGELFEYIIKHGKVRDLQRHSPVTVTCSSLVGFILFPDTL